MAATTPPNEEKGEVDRFVDSFGQQDSVSPAPAGKSEVDELMKSAPSQARGFGGMARDAAAWAVKGAIAVPEAVVGLADIPTGGRVGKFLENEGGAVGFRPRKAKEGVNDWHSEATKDAQRKFQDAEGIGGKFQAAIENPSNIVGAVVESLPSMGAGGLAARGFMAATRLGQMGAKGAAVAGAAGEGLTMAGSQAASIRQETKDGLLTPGQSVASLGTGALGAAFGYGGAKLANKLGIGDVDTMIAQGAKGMARQHADDAAAAAAANPLAAHAAKSIPRQVIEGAITEGFLEELPQSVSEQIIQNLSLDKPWSDGLDDAIVLGTLSGMAMGGPAAGIHAYSKPGGKNDEIESSTQEPGAPAQNPGRDRVRQAFEAQLAALQEQEGGEAPVQQTTPPAGAAILAQRRADELAAGQAFGSPDDEIYQSTGMDVAPGPVRPSESMGLNAADGALSAAAVVAVDSGAALVQKAPDAIESEARQINLDEIEDPNERAYYESFFDDASDPQSGPEFDAWAQGDDNIPDFDSMGNATDEDFLRALGASEQEIADAIANQPTSTPEGAQSTLGAQANDARGPQDGFGQDAQGQVDASASTASVFPGDQGRADVGAAQAPQASTGEPGAASPGQRVDGNAALSAPTGLKEGLEAIREKRAQESREPDGVPAILRRGRLALDNGQSGPDSRQVSPEISKTERKKAQESQATQESGGAPTNWRTDQSAPDIGRPGPDSRQASPETPKVESLASFNDDAGQLDLQAQATEAVGGIRALTAKQIPDMTDAELGVAIAHYGPDHQRTPKLQKEQARRAASKSPQSNPNGAPNVPQADQTQQAAAQPAQAGPAQPAQGLTDAAPAENPEAQGTPAPGAQGAATAEPEFTTLKTTYGDSVTVRTADLNSDKPRLRQYTKDGKSKAVPAIARDNLDPTGGKRAEQAKANADNPLFQVVTTHNGAAFGSAAAAQREVNRLGFSESHEVVPVDGGFVGRKKQAQALDGKAQVAINSEASTEAVAASDGAAPALRRTQPGEAGYTLLDARNDLIELRTRKANQGRVGDDRLGQQISRQEKLIAEMEAQASTQDVQEPPSWESANPKQRQEILDSAMTKLAADDAKAREAAPTNPAAKKPSAAQTRAKADLMNALADLGDILGKNTRINIMPEQEQKLLPVLTRVLDAAFRLGYAKFKDSAKFALDQIRTHLGDEAADALTLDHLQGAYIAMAGGKQGTDTKRAVIDVETKAEIEQHEAAVVAEHAEADNEGNAQSADAPTKEINNADTEPSGHPADQGRAPEVSGRRGVGDDAAARADSGNVEAGQPQDVPAPAESGRAGGDGVRVPGADVGGKRPPGEGGDAANGRTRASRARAPDAGAGNRSGVKNPEEVSPANPGAGNFHIENPLEIVGGGQVARFDKNQAAIDLLNAIREDSRQATAEEQRVLAGYTGWGSFGQELFQGTWEKPMPKDGWQARDKWLREHLGEDEWTSAQRSITNAHYTDPPTVMAMWNMVKRMGFTGGRVLEPSMGIGNFFGMMPADLMARSQLSGIELDSLTGAMAKLLYPDANVKIMGYQESKTPNDFHDVVIGNWPFENTTIADRRYNSLSPFLHDYFFLKAVDQVRPGGLVIGITSNGTMDKKATRIRAALAKKAELVSAIRLPSGAFQEYAGTKVVTDIVILRKREQPLSMVPPDPWINSVSYKTPAGPEVFINEYYVANPGNVIGTTDFGHGTTRMQPGMIVHRPENMAERLRAAVELVPEGAYKKAERTKHITYITNHTADREGALTEQDGQLMVVRGEHLAPAEQVRPYKLKSAAATAQREKELRALIDMRGKYASLIEADRGGADATAQRTALREAYEAFTAEHGPLGDSFGLNYLKRIDDPFRPALAALDVNGRPSAILTGSTMRGAARMENPTAQDAYVLARNSAVEPTIDEIAALAKKPADEVKAALLQSGAIFETPAGAIVPSDIYLSGNVREKLRQAQAGLEEGNAAMQRNVDELSKVVPKDIPYFNIESQLGATWVPPKTYAAYVAHMLNMPDSDAIGVTFINGRWKVKIPDGANRRAEASTGFGTGHYPFSKLVNAAMSNQTVKIRRKDSDGVEHLDTEATDEANGKISDIRGKFGEWLWSDPERRVAQEREYNEVRNAYATPKYDGSFLAFEGMALSLGRGPFNLREHQVNAIWRALVNRRSINGHEVGTGKTFTMGGIAVESRRYGIAKKPVLLAHNANSASVAAEIQQMYPGAKVLYIDNLTPDTIAVKMRQIANDDWDTIVMPHSLIDRLSFREETLMAMAQDDIRSLEEEAYAAADDDGVTITAKMLENDDELKKLRSVTAKELVKARNRIIESIKDQAMRSSKEGAIPFEELGIDMVLVDEVHEFKKPPISTRMNMKGLNTQTSNRSIALQFITRYIRANNNGGNVHTFTGTPITNTLTEIFHQMRYVMEDEMKAAGVETWDGWFGSFAKEVQDVELSAAGEYEAVTRLAGFINVPELRRMIGQYMDVVFADDMPEMQPRRVNGKTMASADLTEAERAELLNGRTEGATDRPYKKVVNVTSDLTAEQKTIFVQLQSYARSWRSMTGKQRKDAMAAGSPESPIITEGMANKASFDVRLTRDSEFAGQEGTAPDDPGSKASKVVANVLEIYRSSPDAAQVIFAEQGYSTSQKRSAGRDAAGNKQYRTVKTFSTMRDIVARLVDQGIPAEQIAMVDGSTSKEKRKEIADAMNALRIRVVIGSTDTLGVGVNMQRNLRAMHHMDAPYMPGELEQRNGRGLRQGNQWNTVMEYRYMTDRLDGRRWQILAIKQRFITAFLKSNSATRVIEGDAAADEDSDILQSFSEAAGDPRILIREKLSKNVEALKRSERLHGNGVADAIQGIRRQNDSIAWAKKRLTEMTANNLPGKVRDMLQAQATNYRATVGKTAYGSRAEAEEAMQQHLQDNIRMEASNVFVGTYAGETVMAWWPSLQSAPHLTITLGNQEFVSGSLRGLESQLRGLPARIEKVQQEINTKSGSIGRLEEVAAAPFARAADLERAKKQFDALVADIAANPVPPPAWLRAGAPVESAAFRNGKEFLVTGHRWNADGWFVLAQDAKGEIAIPFAEVADAQGMPVYEPREFEAPEVHTKEAKAPKLDAAAAPADDGTQFSRTPATKAAYEARIDALFSDAAKALREGVKVLDSSDVMGLLGQERVPLVLSETHVLHDGRTNHPEMTAEVWKRVPEWIENPAAVYTDPKHPGKLTIVAPERLAGYPVLIAVEPNTLRGKPDHLLVTAFAKTTGDLPAYGYLASSGRLRYAETKKAPEVWRLIGDSPRPNRPAPGAKPILTEKHLGGYRRANTPAAFMGQPTAPADSAARNAATQLLVDGLKAKWTRAPEIIVARNMQDTQIPQAVRDYDATLKSQGASGEARGFIYKGKVYLLSDQLMGPQQIAEVLFHEVLGHYGLRGVFGKGLDSILQQMGTMRRADVVAKAREYGLFDSDALGIDSEQASSRQIWEAMSAGQRLEAAEEVLAEMAQTQPNIGFVQRAIAAIRNWLRAHVPGFERMRLTDADIVQKFLLPARGFVTRSNETAQQAIDRAERQSFAPAFSLDDDAGAKALAEFAKADELFALPKSTKDTVEGIAADNDSRFTINKPVNLGGRLEYTLSMPDNTKATLSVRAPNPFGGDQVYDAIYTDEGMELVQGRPGENPDDLPPTGDVWIDVSALKNGDFGAKMYNIAATYAHNTGQIFIGDPHGLSKVALRRRLEQMISSALKFGTTAHLAPHPDQVRGGDGVPPLRWVYGDDVGNVERMIAASVKALDNAFPQSKMIEYRDDGNFYNAKNGKLLPRGRLADGLGQSIAKRRAVDGGAEGTGQAGWRTIARAGLFRHIQSQSPIGREGVPERGRLLDLASAARAGLRSDGSAGPIGSPEERKTRIFYSRAPSDGVNAGGLAAESTSEPSRTTAAGVAARMGDAITSVTLQNIKDQASYKKSDLLGLGLQALGRRQIVDIYGKDLPQLNEYNKLAAQMEADKNEVGAEADQLAQRWGSLRDEKALAELMHDATLAQIDPDKEHAPGDDPAQHALLVGRFNALTNEAKQVYRDARAAYEDHHAKVREAIKQRILRSELMGTRRADLLKRMDDEFFKKTKGVYFPLARFGQYVVAVKGPDGRIASVNRAETMAEAQSLRASLVKAFPPSSGHEVIRPTLSKEFIASRDAVGRGFMTELYGALDGIDMDVAERMELEDTLGQLYLSSLPDLSWAKHGIHRKGTPGFSQDARRAFAQNMFHGGRYLAKLRYADLMQTEITDMQKMTDEWKEVDDFDQPTAQRVVDEMQKRHEALMSPKSNPLSSALTSFGFVFHLGLSPASALVNLSQTALVAYPVMAAKWGFDKSAAALLRASKEAAKGKNDITGSLTDEERAAYDEAVRAGTIDVTMAHDLAGIAQGEDSGVMWRIRPVMRWASFMFHHAERFNRQVTFIAAYRLAKDSGADAKTAFEQATEATYQGHFDYSSGNRPRIMQGNTAKVLLLFKQYGQNMIYTLARSAQQSIKGETPEARREARRALTGLLVMHGLGAGTLGLPLVTTLLAAASMVGGGDDEPWDAKVALQNMLADTFGQKTAEVLMHGVSRLTPWDVSGRIGLDRLILPDVQEGLEGQRLAESAMTAALGPVAGIGVNVLKGVQDIGNGQFMRGLEGMMPAAVRNGVKAIRYASEGAQDKSGIVITDEVNPAEVAGQALGFSPSRVRNASEGKSAILDMDRELGRRRSHLLTNFANARRDEDAEAIKRAHEAITTFNEKNPGRRITVPQMMQSVRARQRRIDQAQDGVYLPKTRRDAMEAGRFALGA